MKINELRVLIQEAIAEETAFLENETPKDKPETKEMTFEELLAAVKKMVTDKQKAAQLVNAIKEGLNENLNEGIFGPTKQETANFETELNNFIETNNIKEKIAAKKLPDSYLEQIKAHVTKIAKTSGFKGGKLGFSNLARPIITYDTQMKTQGKR
jgi:flagellar hook-basal body complex protein FliE